MPSSADPLTETPASSRLQRIRRISRPLVILMTVALALAAIPLALAGLLLLFQQLGSPEAYVSFTANGVALFIGHLVAPVPTMVAASSLSPSQRLLVAGLLLLSTSCSVLALLQLRALFSLYSRGVIFGEENAVRIKRFALWLIAYAVVVNLSGRLFTAVLHAPLQGISNVVMMVVLGAMIYVIGHVMDLGRDADLERKEFV